MEQSPSWKASKFWASQKIIIVIIIIIIIIIIIFFFFFFFSFFLLDGTSPRRTFPSLKDVSQPLLLFDLSFQFVILHMLISVCAQFLHLFFGRPLCWHHWWLSLNTLFTLLLLSILLTRPIQLITLILTNNSTSKSPSSCINSLLYCFLQS